MRRRRSYHHRRVTVYHRYQPPTAGEIFFGLCFLGLIAGAIESAHRDRIPPREDPK